MLGIEQVPAGPDAAMCGDYDEDGDLVNDDCDPCPQDAETTDVDSDGDHIGDICDPDPNDNRTYLVTFDGFRDDRHYSASPGFYHSNGQYLQSLANPNTRAQLGIAETHQTTLDAIVDAIGFTGMGTYAGVSLFIADGVVMDCVEAQTASGMQLQIRNGTTIIGKPLATPAPDARSVVRV